MMQSVGRKYVPYINHTYERSGTLWEGRYKGCLVDHDEYLFTCMRYIELNPVRAGMVSQPEEYRWSSYHSNPKSTDRESETASILVEALDCRLACEFELESLFSYQKRQAK